MTLDVSIYLEGIHSILLLQSKAMNLTFIKATPTLFVIYILSWFWFLKILDDSF